MIAEALLIALALCIDSLVVSVAASFRSRMPWSRGVLMALTFGLFQGGLPLIGALIGSACQHYVEAIDHWIAFALLALVGGNMIKEALHPKASHPQADPTSLGTITLMALATSIDAFVVGIGFGLSMSMRNVLLFSAVIAAVTIAVSIIGVLIGRYRAALSDRYAGIIAGSALILLGLKILIEHLGVI